MMKHLMVVGVVSALVAAVAAGTFAAPAPQKITVTMAEFSFTPKAITLRAGVPAELTLVNKGSVEHEFMVYAATKAAVSDWDEYVMEATYFRDMGEVEAVFQGQGAVASTRMFEVEVEKGRSATVLFTPKRKGTFEIGCHVEGHYEAGMKGTLIVK